MSVPSRSATSPSETSPAMDFTPRREVEMHTRGGRLFPRRLAKWHLSNFLGKDAQPVSHRPPDGHKQLDFGTQDAVSVGTWLCFSGPPANSSQQQSFLFYFYLSLFYAEFTPGPQGFVCSLSSGVSVSSVRPLSWRRSGCPLGDSLHVAGPGPSLGSLARELSGPRHTLGALSSFLDVLVTQLLGGNVPQTPGGRSNARAPPAWAVPRCSQ